MAIMNLADPYPHFYLYKKQYGEGCDYSIGCGLSFSRLQAATMAEAIQEAIAEGKNGECPKIATDGDMSIEVASIFRVEESNEIDVVSLGAARHEAQRKQEQVVREKNERKYLAELKAKYETKELIQ